MGEQRRKRFLLGTLLGAFAAFCFALTPLGLRLERLAIDTHSGLLAQRKGPSADIVLVTLDDETFDVLAEDMEGLHWPFPRALHAQVVQNLLDAGVRAVALDIIFDLPSGYGREDDEAFAKVLTSGKVYLSSEESAQAITPILPYFQDSGARAANTALPVDIDGIIRFSPGALPLPRSAKEAARYYFGADPVRAMTDVHSDFAARIGTDLYGSAGEGLLAFSSSHPFPKISYFEIYKKELFEKYRPELKDKIVFIGRTPSASITPQQQADTHLSPIGFLPGIEIHATHLQNVLDNSLRSVTGGRSVSLLLVLWTGFILAGLNRLPRISHAFVFSFSAAVLWEVFAAGMFYIGSVVPAILPFALTLFPFLTALAVRYLEERDARLITRAQLFHYLPPRVAEHVLKNSAKEAVAADRKEITILFGDVAGFTSLSERETPELVLSLLQTHLKDMAETIFRHEGTLDKYIGDGIMAFWNAPEEQSRHADLAVSAAIEMLERVETANEARKARGEPVLVLRIGLHTGEAIVGNIGSELFFDYTAIGDSVNTASRLEGANKAFGSRLLISDAVQRRLTPETAARVSMMARVTLVGKSEPIEVFTFVPPGQEENFSRLRAVISALDARQTETARDSLKQLLAAEPDFLPAAFQLEQISVRSIPSFDIRGRSYWPLSSK